MKMNLNGVPNVFSIMGHINVRSCLINIIKEYILTPRYDQGVMLLDMMIK